MSTTRPDLDETARLIFMEDPLTRMKPFADLLREIHPDEKIDLATITGFFHKYAGYWGPPTHNVETGERLR